MVLCWLHEIQQILANQIDLEQCDQNEGNAVMALSIGVHTSIICDGEMKQKTKGTRMHCWSAAWSQIFAKASPPPRQQFASWPVVTAAYRRGDGKQANFSSDKNFSKLRKLLPQEEEEIQARTLVVSKELKDFADYSCNRGNQHEQKNRSPEVRQTDQGILQKLVLHSGQFRVSYLNNGKFETRTAQF